MRFIIVADIHFDNPNSQGFSMQEKYTEQAGEILDALGRAAAAEHAEFIIHAPTNGFEKTGDRIIREFHPLLIAGGHNHLNILEKIDTTYAVTASSPTEAPFEYKLLEFADGGLSMRTCSLGGEVSFPFRRDPARKFVQGEACDRAFFGGGAPPRP